MRDKLLRFFLHQWHKKLTAFVAATIIWVLVNHSITITRTIPNVPVRVLNLPDGKTVEGLLAGGLLPKRVTLTITGQKSSIESLLPTDLEVCTDAAGKGDRWTVEVTKKNLVSLNPDIDLVHAVSGVSPVEVSVELSPLVVEKIPVTIMRPIGEPPKGFIFLDVWPQKLEQTVSGPKERVEELKHKGLKLTFDLSKVSKDELEQLYEKNKHLPEDETRFFVPENWKKVSIPFERSKSIALNDPDAGYLHLDFLKKELLPLQDAIPVTVYFPPNKSRNFGPDLYTLDTDGLISRKNGLFLLNLPVSARNVSRFFLDIVRDHLQITFVASNANQPFSWSVQFIDPKGLEEAYVTASLEAASEDQKLSANFSQEYLRARFRNYLHEFTLFGENGEPLNLVAELQGHSILVHAS